MLIGIGAVMVIGPYQKVINGKLKVGTRPQAETPRSLQTTGLGRALVH